MMNKDKRRMTEKILNYALEIIFVLTGEEYTIVKKKSPHCGTDPLTGEVPIKCDDVAVYFSLEEWEYIEGHKELYKDLMMGTSEKRRTVKTPSNSSGHHDISAGGEIENERDKTDIQLMEAEAASCAEEDIADIISDTEQTEDQCARSHQVDDKNICEAISQVEVTRRQDENTDTVWISDEEDEKSENDAQLEEPCSDSCTDGTISLNMYCEPAAVWDSEEDVEDDPTLCNRVHEEDAERNSTNKLNMRDEENMASTSASYQCAQTSCQNERSQSEYSDATMGIWEVKKETTDCANQTSRTAVCEDHQAPSTPEKPCTSNKNRKQVTPGSKLNVDKTPHPGETSFICNECGRQFIYISHLLSHQKSHSRGKPFVCPHCGKCFAQRSNLVAHNRIHTGEKPYICRVCGKAFSERSNVAAHLRTHTGEKPYMCPVCGKSFTQRSILGRHLKTHSGERPYACSDCGKSFTQKSNLVSHQRIHTGRNLYCYPV